MPKTATAGIPLVNQFNAQNAYNAIETQIEFGYRIPGTLPNRNCVQWIYNQFNTFGQAYIYNFTVEGTVCQNVIGKLNPGHDSIIIFAAHFDSRAIAEYDTNVSKQSTPIEGANDGASGVAVMLEMARIIATSAISSNYEFWFVFFDAEDQGKSSIGPAALSNWDWCEGSSYMANDMNSNPSKYFSLNQSINSIKAFILLDMVGGTALQFIQEQFSDQNLLNSIFSVGQSLDYSSTFPSSPIQASIDDDHYPFKEIGISTADLVIDFWDSSPPWHWHHTTNDTIENIDPNSLLITGRTLLQVISTYYLSSSTESIPTTNNSEYFGFTETEAILLVTSIAIVAVIMIFVIKTRKKSTNN
jgi:Zn-dependent M28 family amino/carboxypeptidase